MADVFTKTKRSAGNFATGRGGVRAYFAAPPMKDHTNARLRCRSTDPNCSRWQPLV